MKQFAPAHPSEVEIGPLTKALRGRRLADVSLADGGMHVRCHDGVVVRIQWSSRGAELAGLQVLEASKGVPPLQLAERFRYMIGKTIDCVRSEEGVMGIVTTDHHILRCDWRYQEPKPVAVDVRVPIECPPGVGMSGVIIH